MICTLKLAGLGEPDFIVPTNVQEPMWQLPGADFWVIVVTVDPLADIFLEDVGDQSPRLGKWWLDSSRLPHSATGDLRPSRPKTPAHREAGLKFDSKT